ncbi:MAG: hypothetical protein AB1505_07240 [Candidatus Latescibacterota bacterium]
MERLVDVVHIGFPKTGTTWVQLEVIPYVPDLVILCKPEPVDRRYRDLLNRFVGCPGLDFSPEAFRAEFSALQAEHACELGPGKVRMISFELLSGELYAGADAVPLLERIHRTFGPVQILITVREQRAMVESVYRHYVASGGALHLREVLYKPGSPSVDVWGNRHLLLKFRYDRTLELCRRLFGPHNVRVVPFEWIVRDPERFKREFLGFAGVSMPAIDPGEVEGARNAGLSYAAIHLLRWVNQVVSTPLSDSPLLRSVPFVYTRFIHRLCRPLDEALLGRVGRRRRFVEMSRRWWTRRWLRRLLALLLRREEVDAVRHPLLADVVRFLNWPDLHSPALRGGEESIAAEIARVYAPSNRRLAEMTGLPLAELGYALAAPGASPAPEAS